MENLSVFSRSGELKFSAMGFRQTTLSVSLQETPKIVDGLKLLEIQNLHQDKIQQSRIETFIFSRLPDKLKIDGNDLIESCFDSSVWRVIESGKRGQRTTVFVKQNGS